MSEFLFGINLVLPLFIVILIGAVLRKSKVLNDTAVDSLTTIVYNVALPAKLFLDNISIDFTQVFNIKFILFAGIMSFVFFLILFILVPIFVKDKSQISAIIHGGFRGNFVYVGIPMIERILSKSPVPVTSLIVVFIIPFYNVLGVFVLNYFGKEKEEFKPGKLLIDIIKNPMIFSIFAGIPFSILQTQFPSFVTDSLGILGSISTPVALMLIGASLKVNTFKGDYVKIIATTVVKTILQPIIVVPLAIKLNFNVDEIITLFILFSVPPANNVYIMTKKMGGDADLVSSFMVTSLIVTMCTIPIGISILSSVGIL